MKNFIKLMLLPALLLGAMACSNDASDEPVNNENQGHSNEVFLSFQVVQASDGSRSSTESDGSSTDENEIASAEESAINNIVFVVVDDANDKVVAKSTSFTPGTAGTYVCGFESSALLRYVGNSGSSRTANFYAFCNIDANNIVANVDEPFDFDQVLAATDDTPWTDNAFWMTNADATSLTLTIPQRSMLQNYTSPETAYFINEGSPLKVERTCARFDYQSSKNPDTANENEYYIYDYTYNASTGFTKNTSKKLASITLVAMTVVNESTKAYGLKRVSADGSATSTTLLGAETPTNYVVAWDAADKLTWANTPTANYSNSESYKNCFAISGYQVRNLTNWVSLNNWSTTGTDDNDGGGWPAGTTNYKKFKYLLPNTMQLNSQMKGFTTGVVFRGKITADDSNTALKESMAAGNTIMAYDNVILCDRTHMSGLVGTMDAGNPIKTAYTAAEAQITSEGTSVDERIREIYVEHGFKCIQQSPSSLGASDNDYYVYYYYWNRHNDNHNANLMGPMEFAVVRNNVYKLCVTEINMIGHPYNPADDPDPENPDDPDENGKIYLKVAVQVLPWVVRINNITF